MKIYFIYLFIYFISIFIFLTRRKATEALIHRVGNYPDLLLEMPRYCCPLVIFNRHMTVIQNCLPEPPSRGMCRNVSFPRTQQNGASGFLNRDRVGHEPGALTTRPCCRPDISVENKNPLEYLEK